RAPQSQHSPRRAPRHLRRRYPIPPPPLTAAPTQIRQVSSRLHLTRPPTLVSRVHLPVSLPEPAPSGSTGTSRVCQGRLPPTPVTSPRQAALSFTGLLRQLGDGGLSPPFGKQAPHGAGVEDGGRRSRRQACGSPGTGSRGPGRAAPCAATPAPADACVRPQPADWWPGL